MTATSEKLPDSDTYYMGIAIAVREKANCTGNRVGAVAVLENRVISTGYNVQHHAAVFRLLEGTPPSEAAADRLSSRVDPLRC